MKTSEEIMDNLLKICRETSTNSTEFIENLNWVLMILGLEMRENEIK